MALFLPFQSFFIFFLEERKLFLLFWGFFFLRPQEQRVKLIMLLNSWCMVNYHNWFMQGTSLALFIYSPFLALPLPSPYSRCNHSSMFNLHVFLCMHSWKIDVIVWWEFIFNLHKYVVLYRSCSFFLFILNDIWILNL